MLCIRGVVGPEGFPLAHVEEAEEEATRRITTFAHQVNRIPIQFKLTPTSVLLTHTLLGSVQLIKKF
jgi:hypothetical protein